MDDTSPLLDYARKKAEFALMLDKSKNYSEAKVHYVEAAETLIQALKFEKQPETRKALRQRAELYISRAKDLQEAIQKDSAKKMDRSAARDGENGDSGLNQALADSILTEKPDVRFDDVAGLENVKQALREAIILPLARPDIFEGARKPWKGILMFGPPGTGKTMLAKASAAEVDASFFNVSSATIMSKWLGESEKLVRQLFRIAQEKAPSIVFVDEVDALTQTRGGENEAGRRVKTQLLTSMDGLTSDSEKPVVVIGATNVPWEIDAAFRRRFERRIFIPLPDPEAREHIFRVSTSGLDLKKDVNFAKLSELSHGYSGADIALLCREAIMYPIREMDKEGALTDPDILPRQVEMNDFVTAFSNTKPSVVSSELGRYFEWSQQFGSG